MNDLNFLSAVGMAAQIRGRTVLPPGFVDRHLARIAELNCGRESKLNAFVHVDVDAARAQAKIAESAVRSGTRADSFGPLHGVPIFVKSSVDVTGWPCERGSRRRQG